MSECRNCGRGTCEVEAVGTCLTGEWSEDRWQEWITKFRLVNADCKANTIDWRERALSLEDKLAVAEAKLAEVRSWAVFNARKPPAKIFPDKAFFLSVRRGCAQTILVILDSKETL